MRFPILTTLIASLFLVGCFEQPDDRAQSADGQAALSSPAVRLTGRVTDHAGVFTPAQRVALSTKLEQLERDTKHQMVVVTVASLGGKEIEPFTTDLANAWGVGRKDHDDGVVVLLAPNERKIRIAVGYGLESTLTDERCSEIIKQSMLPHFQQRDMYRGVEEGVDALIKSLS